MRRALIGSTGFIGGNLCRQTHFDDLYHSSNVSEIANREYTLVVCTAPSAWKWRANQDPEGDRAHVQALIEPLRRVKAELFVLISTVDVYAKPVGVDEDTLIDPSIVTPYGRHRFQVEETVRACFPHCCIVRLAHPFGDGLKKNFLYDLMHQHRLDLTHCESVFQFYPIQWLWQDIERIVDHGLTLVNLATEPVTAREVASACFGMEFTNVTDKPSVQYDMRSKYGRLLGWGAPYRYGKDEVFREIRDFAQQSTGSTIQ